MIYWYFIRMYEDFIRIYGIYKDVWGFYVDFYVFSITLIGFRYIFVDVQRTFCILYRRAHLSENHGFTAVKPWFLMVRGFRQHREKQRKSERPR